MPRLTIILKPSTLFTQPLSEKHTNTYLCLQPGKLRGFAQVSGATVACQVILPVPNLLSHADLIKKGIFHVNSIQHHMQVLEIDLAKMYETDCSQNLIVTTSKSPNLNTKQ